VKDPAKQEQTIQENQSKRTREISSVNKSHDVTKKILHRYTSVSSTTTTSVRGITMVSAWNLACGRFTNFWKGRKNL